MPTIQFKRGAVSGLPSGSAGEPLFTTDQFRLHVGSAGGNRLMSVLKKIDGTTAPTVNDDAGDGFSVGSVWTDTTNDKSYICSDSTVGAAVWQQFSGAGGVSLTTGVTGVLPMANGGTGSNLTDPNADRLMFWDDSAGAVAFLTPGTGLTITGTTIDAATLADGDKGDITVSGSGATWTIDNDVVTYAKMQNISATQKLLGRNTAGAGDTEEVTATQFLDWITGAAGSMLFRQLSPAVWAQLTPPASGNGQALRWDSGNTKPSWSNPVHSRTVLGSSQTFSSASGTFAAVTGLSVTIPAAGVYAIDVALRTLMLDSSAGGYAITRLALNGTAITNTEMISSYSGAAGVFAYDTVSQTYRGTFAASDVISVQFAASYTGTPSAIRGVYSDSSGRSSISYFAL